VTAHPSILIVDDDEPFRRRLARAFADRGFDARQAADYESAMAAARAESPEYAVVDQKMPGRSGLELARDLLAVDPTTKIVILTGYASVATTAWAMRLGVAWYLPKPADADDILAAFARAGVPAAALADPPREPEAPSLERAKWEHIQRVLLDCDGNVSEAARRLAMHRRSLQRMLVKYPPAK
jgi:two-component system response regulator RegA